MTNGQVATGHVMSPLYGELHRWMAQPFQWGQTDCCLVLADWVERVAGVDVAADLRQTYDDAGSCQRVTGFLRDPLAVTTRLMEDVGSFARTEAPVAGDVAVLRAWIGGEVKPFGALCLGPEGWAAKSPQGVIQIHRRQIVDMLRAWSVGYEG